MTAPQRRAVRLLVVNLALGLLLFAFMYSNERMRFPGAAEWPARMLYNTVFGFTLPMQALLEPFRDRDAHNSAVWARFVAYTLTPLLVTGLFAAFLRARRAQIDARARRTAAKAPASAEAPALTRRAFLLGGTDAAVAATGAGFSAYSTWREPWHLAVRRYTVPVQGLPAAMDGYTIAQISDTHYGPFVPMRHIRNAIQLANSLQPDFTVLTGDYIHRARESTGDAVAIFSELEAKHGVAAVLGNHDHWEDAPKCREVFGQLGVPLLDHGRIFLAPAGRVDDARPGAGLCLAGVGDLWEDVVNVRYSLRDLDPDLPRVLLSHNPDVAETVPPGTRLDLMLSGHTHGGQISVPYRGVILVPSAYGKKYAGGECRGPRCPVIVSRGVGLAVMPYRFRVRPEVVHITLRQA